MQNHPGLWYLPWGMHMQKLSPVQFQQLGTPPPQAAFTPTAAATPTGSPVACHQVLPGQHQHSPNSTTMLQVQTASPTNYQHHALHAAAGPHVTSLSAYSCPSAGANTLHATAPTAAHSPVLNGHGHSHLQTQSLQNPHVQALHPATAAAAAAAMFTPLSLRTFLTSTANPLAGLSAQQSLAACGPTNVHQHQHQHQHQQSAAVAAAAAAAAAQQLTCLPTQVTAQRQAVPASGMNLNVGVVALRQHAVSTNGLNTNTIPPVPTKKLVPLEIEKSKIQNPEKRKADDSEQIKDLKKAKLETKALKAKRPGFTDERYHETSYYIENGLRKVYPYYFTFTTFTKGRWVGEKILDVFAREFRAHPAEEYERCIKAGTLTVNYEKVPIDYRLKHNDLLANIVHRHEVPVTSQPITIVHMDDDIVVVNKPASIPVHPCGRYRHNTVVFILAKEYNLKNLRTIHRLDRLTSGLLLFGRSPKKARQMEHQIRNRQVQKEYICQVEGNFPDGIIECKEPIEVVSYKIGVCKVSSKGKDCTTTFQKIAHNGETSVVLCKPLTGRMHQIRVHLQYLGYPVVNDPLYNHEVFGPLKGRGGDVGGKTDEELVRDLINIHNAENWLGIDGDSEMSLFKSIKGDCDVENLNLGVGAPKGHTLSDDDSETVSRETSPCSESPRPVTVMLRDIESSNEGNTIMVAENVGNELVSVAVGTEAVVPARYGLTSVNGNVSARCKVTVATQTGHESPDMAFDAEKMTSDKHCYECKVRYRDPKPKDLVMYLHAWKYKGPGWEYETDLPSWAITDWVEPKSD